MTAEERAAEEKAAADLAAADVAWKIQSAKRIEDKIRKLNELAKRRGQSLAQMSLAWVLRDPRVTTVLIGASSIAQLDQNLACLENRSLSEDELAAIEAIVR